VANHCTPTEPHPLVIFGGSNSLDLAAQIAHHLNVEMGEANTTPHPNGESMVRIATDVRHRDVFVVQSVSRRWMPTPERPHTGINDNFFELLTWVDALARASAHRITAVIPHFGYARQDRKAAGRTPISAKVVATCLEEIGCNRVLTLDLHSDQIQGFFTHCTKLDHLNAGKLFADHFQKLGGMRGAVVLAADVGNLKKADKYRRGIPDTDIAIVDKRRDPKTGEIVAKRIIGDVRDRTVLMFDDIISTAGTMRAGIDLAYEEGAKEFYLAATHGEFVGSAIERLSHPAVTEVCVTDSIPPLPSIKERLPLHVLGIAGLLGDAIDRIHKGESISELLGPYS
jgi:ribose-phosphate pyrophosphokinase